jgi:nucleoid DNA-binding protein
MTQKEISKRIAIRTNLEQYRIKQTIDVFFDIVKEAMIKEGRVNIKGFGTFYTAPIKRNGKTFAVCKISFARPFKQEVREKTDANDLRSAKRKKTVSFLPKLGSKIQAD